MEKSHLTVTEGRSGVSWLTAGLGDSADLDK